MKRWQDSKLQGKDQNCWNDVDAEIPSPRIRTLVCWLIFGLMCVHTGSLIAQEAPTVAPPQVDTSVSGFIFDLDQEIDAEIESDDPGGSEEAVEDNGESGEASEASENVSAIWIEDYEKARVASKLQRKPMFVVCGAPWCGWCKKLMDELGGAPTEELGKKWVLSHVDVDADIATGRTLQANALPALRIVAASGEVIASREGYLPYTQLSEWLDANYDAAKSALPSLLDDSTANVTSDNLDDWIELLGARKVGTRGAAVDRIVMVPEIAVEPIIELLRDPKLSKRLAALEVLRRWDAPVVAMDPWVLETITDERLAELQAWRSARWPAEDIDAGNADDEETDQSGSSAQPNGGADSGNVDLFDLLGMNEPLDQEATGTNGVDSEGQGEEGQEGSAELPPAELSPAERAALEKRVSDYLIADEGRSRLLMPELVREGKRLLPLLAELVDEESSDELRRRVDALRYQAATSEQTRLKLSGPLELLTDDDVQRRVEAAEVIAKSAKFADRDLLSEMLRDSNPNIRELAVSGLVRIAPKTSADLLAGLLNDPDANLRASVLKRLAETESPSAIKPVLEYVQRETDTDMLLYAIRYLRTGVSPAITDQMVRLCEHDDWRIRAAAVETLNARLGGHSNAKPKSEVVEALLKLAVDADPFVASRASENIESLVSLDNLDRVLKLVGDSESKLARVIAAVSETPRQKRVTNAKLWDLANSEDAVMQRMALRGWLYAPPPQMAVQVIPQWIDSEDEEFSVLAIRLALNLIERNREHASEELPLFPDVPMGESQEANEAVSEDSGAGEQPSSSGAVVVGGLLALLEDAFSGEETASQEAGEDKEATTPEASMDEEIVFDFESVVIENEEDRAGADTLQAEDPLAFLDAVQVESSVSSREAAGTDAEGSSSSKATLWGEHLEEDFGPIQVNGEDARYETREAWRQAWYRGEIEVVENGWNARLVAATERALQGDSAAKKAWASLLSRMLPGGNAVELEFIIREWQEGAYEFTRNRSADDPLVSNKSMVVPALMMPWLGENDRTVMVDQLKAIIAAEQDQAMQKLYWESLVENMGAAGGELMFQQIIEFADSDSVTAEMVVLRNGMRAAIGYLAERLDTNDPAVVMTESEPSVFPYLGLEKTLVDDIEARARNFVSRGDQLCLAMLILLDSKRGKELALEIANDAQRETASRVLAAKAWMINSEDGGVNYAPVINIGLPETAELGLAALYTPGMIYESMPVWMLPPGEEYWYPSRSWEQEVELDFDIDLWLQHENRTLAGLATMAALEQGRKDVELDPLLELLDESSVDYELALAMTQMLAKGEREEDSEMQLEALRKIEKVLADEQYYLSRFYQHIRSMKSSWAIEYRNELSKRYGAGILSSGFGY